MKVPAGVHALLCGLSLLLIPASANGWFGMDPDPLGGVFAVLLALPWSLELSLIFEVGMLSGIVVLVAAMFVNTAILCGIARLLERKR